MLLSTIFLSFPQKALFAVLMNNFTVTMHSLFIADVCNPNRQIPISNMSITMTIVETIKTFFYF